jgi:hypothetical protein
MKSGATSPAILIEEQIRLARTAEVLTARPLSVTSKVCAVWNQVATAGANFGEVGICQFKMLSSKGILVFKSPPTVRHR